MPAPSSRAGVKAEDTGPVQQTGAERVCTDLVLVLGDVRVDLVQGAHAVELAQVQPRLLSQVGAHILVADGGHLGYVSVVPALVGL